MSKNGRSFLLLVSSGLILLVVLSVWTVRHCNNKNSFRLVKVVMCYEVDETFMPVGVASSFSYGTRQLCLWFEYGLVSRDCTVDVKWYFDGNLVSTENVVLSSAVNKKSFCLLREDGSPLPVGAYYVELIAGGRVAGRLDFKVS